PRARPRLRLGAGQRWAAPPHRARAALALRARRYPGRDALRVRPRRLAAARRRAPDAEPVRHRPDAAGHAAALRQLSLLLRAADADGVLVPAAPPPVEHAVRRRRLDGRL